MVEIKFELNFNVKRVHFNYNNFIYINLPLN